jgi:hypothetical protein
MPIKAWTQADTERRLDNLKGGCNTIEEARAKYPMLVTGRVNRCWRNRTMGGAIRRGYPELFQTLHERWKQEYIINGNVMSKVEL